MVYGGFASCCAETVTMLNNLPKNCIERVSLGQGRSANAREICVPWAWQGAPAALLLAALALASGCDLCDGIERADSKVFRLTATTVDQSLAAHELALVGFYAPWCEVCKWFAPHYEQVAEVLRAEGVLVAKVNVADEPALARNFGAEVRQAPVLVIVRRGVRIPYAGGRRASELIQAMREHSRPPVLELGILKGSAAAVAPDALAGTELDSESVAEAVRVFSTAEPAYLSRVLVRSPQPAAARDGAMDLIDRVAGAMRGDVAFARAPPLRQERAAAGSAAGEGALEGSGTCDTGLDAEHPCIQMLRPWVAAAAEPPEPTAVWYSGPLDFQRLLDWARWRSLPLSAELSASNAAAFLSGGSTALLALDGTLNSEARRSFVEAFQALAAANAAAAGLHKNRQDARSLGGGQTVPPFSGAAVAGGSGGARSARTAGGAAGSFLPPAFGSLGLVIGGEIRLRAVVAGAVTLRQSADLSQV
mmetsp:Transcript_19170/g.48818  ORF Transcript_19170/g.48818 Transcript_19170/m.48818 type:complete len:477 (-) Transcript_19170:661-2091(-)